LIERSLLLTKRLAAEAVIVMEVCRLIQSSREQQAVDLRMNLSEIGERLDVA